MKRLKIALAQYPLTKFSTPEEWAAHVRKWIELAAVQKSAIAVFPEYGSLELLSLSHFASDDLKQQLLAIQDFLPLFRKTFQILAQEHQLVIVSPSFPVKINQIVVNRAFVYFPDGKEDFQDKQMMTRFEDEEWMISSGVKDIKVWDFCGVKWGLNICYDSEFPQFANRQAQQGLELLIVPSCTETEWGLHRVHVGSRARALEQQIFVAVSHTVGDAPWSLAVDKNTGKASVFGPCDLGFPRDGVIVSGELNKAGWEYCDLDFSLIENVRKNGQVLNFRDNKRINF